MMDWKDISTAPKDGSDVLVAYDLASVIIVHVAYWDDDEHDLWQEQGFASKAEKVGWWSYVNSSVSQDKLDGIHAPQFWAPYTPPEPRPC